MQSRQRGRAASQAVLRTLTAKRALVQVTPLDQPLQVVAPAPAAQQVAKLLKPVAAAAAAQAAKKARRKHPTGRARPDQLQMQKLHALVCSALAYHLAFAS